MICPKEYNFSTVKGISSNQLEQHYILYTSYIKKLNEIWQLLKLDLEFSPPNSTYSDLRCLKLGESYALNGVKLHEMYFENITGQCKDGIGEIFDYIKRDYGNYERWKQRFMDISLSVRGWTVLAWEPIDMRLHIYGQDTHDKGSIWCSFPLLVIDDYEHAYMIDFGIDKSEYLNIIMENINWNVVNSRFLNIIK